jgi:hypothetical protein
MMKAMGAQGIEWGDDYRRAAGEAVDGADHEALMRLSSELVVCQTRVDTTEEQWLALAAQAESLGMDI